MDHMPTYQKLEQVFDKSAVPFCFIHKDASMLNFNKQFERAFGYSREEVKTLEDWFQLACPDSDYRKWVIDKCYSEIERAVETNSDIKPIEYNVTCKNGDVRTAMVFGSFIGDDILLTFFDITERKQAEEALRESEEKYRMVVETANDGIFIAQDGVIKFSNPRTAEITGYTADELSKIQFTDIIHPEHKDLVVGRHLKRLKGETPPSSYSFKIINKAGEELWVQLNAELINWENRPATINVLRNITEKRRLEDQLRQSQKMEAIGNLAGGIAHDFNNILSSIIGFTELALDEASKGTLLEDSLQEVYTAGKRAKDLVKQILAFARQSDEKSGPIQPGVIVKEVLNFIRSTIPATIEIQESIKSESLILGNSTQVHQVLMNLCTNAANAMEDSGGTLELNIRDMFVNKTDAAVGMRQGDYVEITVSDTGVGIPPEAIESIFEPYFTTKSIGEGTGLGLAVAHGIIESYGGKITIESELEKGTKFTIYLPITKKRSGQDVYVPEQLPTGTERILFVDDEAPIAKMGSQMLECLGYSVTPRTSSIEALELFQTKADEFDLVVTDMTMPNMTGDKLAVEIMKIRRDIPVILCTGYSKKISDETASEVGIKAFAYKPVVKTELAITVRKVLDDAKG